MLEEHTVPYTRTLVGVHTAIAILEAVRKLPPTSGNARSLDITTRCYLGISCQRTTQSSWERGGGKNPPWPGNVAGMAAQCYTSAPGTTEAEASPTHATSSRLVRVYKETPFSIRKKEGKERKKEEETESSFVNDAVCCLTQANCGGQGHTWRTLHVATTS